MLGAHCSELATIGERGGRGKGVIVSLFIPNGPRPSLFRSPEGLLLFLEGVLVSQKVFIFGLLADRAPYCVRFQPHLSGKESKKDDELIRATDFLKGWAAPLTESGHSLKWGERV